MRAVIVAGGKGVRLHPLTKVLPKPLIPLSDLPILEIILRQLSDFGYTHVTLSLGYRGSFIYHYFGDGDWLGLKIDYTYEDEPLGTAGPLRLVKNLDEPFLFMNADVLTDLDFRHFYQIHTKSDALATIMLYNHELNVGFGIIETDEAGHVTGYKEKPKQLYPISSGIYMLSRGAVAYVKDKPLDMPDLIMSLLLDGQSVQSYFHQGIWMDIGTLPQLQEAGKVFEENRSMFLQEKILKQTSNGAGSARVDGKVSKWIGK
ncbi:sugar phosphate nucleotidyltransferase [Paenibacillus sp.]|jgi:NDP-sugar pyrophosphorylase family protein|uniref:sugar phosphate nucleotidyltransferase n=1 Tax=Paenibacillus sp. TaxID=58172 RepID=UPI00283381EA|nr:sugar phosphate nucleotidyltransferase [Paenibacillus sp.]MDR0267485.1 hypothetical protein [Paenibacillus sp.]